MRVAIRGWKKNALAFEEFIEVEEDDGNELEKLGETHALRLKDEAHMIEFEFLDEPDQEQRFFRFGTDATRMVSPIEIDLEWKP